MTSVWHGPQVGNWPEITREKVNSLAREGKQ